MGILHNVTKPAKMCYNEGGSRTTVSEPGTVSNFPLSSLYQCISLLRSFRAAGRVVSKQINPDRVQSSLRLYKCCWVDPNGDFVEMEVADPRIPLYNSVAGCWKKALNYQSPARRNSIIAAVRGLPDPESNTGNYITLSPQEVANYEGRSVRTIHRWIAQFKDDFERELVARKIIPAPDL